MGFFLYTPLILLGGSFSYIVICIFRFALRDIIIRELQKRNVTCTHIVRGVCSWACGKLLEGFDVMLLIKAPVELSLKFCALL